MKLTSATRHALRALVHLTRHGGQGPVPSHDIAPPGVVSPGRMVRVLAPLVAAGVLRAARGIHGGYRLARPAMEIKLLEVVEAVAGPVQAQAAGGGAAPETQLQAACHKAAEVLCERLRRVSLADLAGSGQ
jgi:Rrf2 family protein